MTDFSHPTARSSAAPRAAMTSPTRREQAFTLIEILVAIAVIGLLTAVLSSAMVGMLRVNRSSGQRLDLTTSVQRVAESVRGNWLTQVSYDRVCAGVTLPEGVSVKFINLDSRGNLLSAGDTGEDIKLSACPSQPINGAGSVPPILRRVVVAGSDGKQSLSVELDVMRPQQ